MQLSDATYTATRKALLAPGSEQLIDLAFRMALGRPVGAELSEARDAAVGLGWLKPETYTFKPEGWLLADSLREYQFWQQRDRKLPLEGQIAYHSQAYYSGKSVAEIGCGYGSNLYDIRRTADSVIGVEPCRVYHQMSAILAEREGVEPLKLRLGRAEETPLESNSCDLVLCVSVHQYTDVRAAIREMARILRPGGELQIVGGTLGSFTYDSAVPMLTGSLRSAYDTTRTIANTLSYMAVGRRVAGAISRPNTGFPVYPTEAIMDRWLRSAGLIENRPRAHAWPETVFNYRKPEA